MGNGPGALLARLLADTYLLVLLTPLPGGSERSTSPQTYQVTSSIWVFPVPSQFPGVPLIELASVA